MNPILKSTYSEMAAKIQHLAKTESFLSSKNCLHPPCTQTSWLDYVEWQLSWLKHIPIPFRGTPKKFGIVGIKLVTWLVWVLDWWLNSQEYSWGPQQSVWPKFPGIPSSWVLKFTDFGILYQEPETSTGVELRIWLKQGKEKSLLARIVEILEEVRKRLLR